MPIRSCVFFEFAESFVQRYNRELKTLLDNPIDDADIKPDLGELRDHPSNRGRSTEKKERRRIPLEELTRFTMVKRIW
jgi:hypothetical protein